MTNDSVINIKKNKFVILNTYPAAFCTYVDNHMVAKYRKKSKKHSVPQLSFSLFVQGGK